MEKALYSEKSAEFHVATCIDGSAAPEKVELLRTKSREDLKLKGTGVGVLNQIV